MNPMIILTAALFLFAAALMCQAHLNYMRHRDAVTLLGRAAQRRHDRIELHLDELQDRTAVQLSTTRALSADLLEAMARLPKTRSRKALTEGTQDAADSAQEGDL